VSRGCCLHTYYLLHTNTHHDCTYNAYIYAYIYIYIYICIDIDIVNHILCVIYIYIFFVLMCIVYCVCVSTYHMSLVAAPLRHLHMPRTQWQPRLLSGIAGLLQRFLELKNGPDYFRRMLHDVTVLSFGRLNLCIYIYMHNTIHIIPVHRHVFVNIVLRQKYD
jgi:hypothetical protein